jgi:hypothetical protein
MQRGTLLAPVRSQQFPCSLARPRAEAGEDWSERMYFVLMILIALAAAGLVLFLEHRGDPRVLELEYKSDQSNRTDEEKPD